MGTDFSCIISLKKKKKPLKKPEFISSRKANVFVLTWHCFFKVSSANEIPQPWAVLGIRCWFLKYGDILLQILRQPRNDECWGVWEEGNFQIHRSSAVISHAKQTARGSCFREGFCYSFEIPSADVGQTAHFHHANLLILIFWA